MSKTIEQVKKENAERLKKAKQKAKEKHQKKLMNFASVIYEMANDETKNKIDNANTKEELKTIVSSIILYKFQEKK